MYIPISLPWGSGILLYSFSFTLYIRAICLYIFPEDLYIDAPRGEWINGSMYMVDLSLYIPEKKARVPGMALYRGAAPLYKNVARAA